MANKNNLPLPLLEKFVDPRGQSLIELLVGMALVLIVLLAIAVLSTRSVQLADVSQYQIVATELARQGVEGMRSQRNQQLWTDFAQTRTLPATTHAKDGINFTRVIRKTRVDPQKLQVLIEVSWQDTTGTHTVDQTTLLTNWQ